MAGTLNHGNRDVGIRLHGAAILQCGIRAPIAPIFLRIIRGLRAEVGAPQAVEHPGAGIGPEGIRAARADTEAGSLRDAQPRKGAQLD